MFKHVSVIYHNIMYHTANILIENMLFISFKIHKTLVRIKSVTEKKSIQLIPCFVMHT